MFKKKIGNSTDNKVINKKILLICIPVVILVISIITLFATGTFSKLMGNSVVDNQKYLDYVTIGDFNLDGQINWDDYYLLADYNTAIYNGQDVSNYSEDQLRAGDITNDGIVYFLDQIQLRCYLTGNCKYNSERIGKRFCGYYYTTSAQITGNNEVANNFCERRDSASYKTNVVTGNYNINYSENYQRVEKFINYKGSSGSFDNLYPKTDSKNLSANFTEDININNTHNSKSKYFVFDKTRAGVLVTADKTVHYYLCYVNNNHSSIGYIEESSCEKYGYVSVDHNPKRLIEPKGGVDLYDYYTLANYLIVYDGENYSPDACHNVEKYVKKDETVKIEDPKITYNNISDYNERIKNYIFLGWTAELPDFDNSLMYCYTNSNKSEKKWVNESSCKQYGYVYFKPGTDIKNLTNPGRFVSFKPVWEDDSYNVSFDANSDDSVVTGKMDSIKLKVSDNKKISKNQFAKSGYAFLGWYANKGSDWYCYTDPGKTKAGWTNSNTCSSFGYVLIKDETVLSKINNFVKVGDSIHLLAQFEKSKYTLKFNANGGSGRMPDQKLIYGLSTSISSNKFSKPGYLFKGWYAKRSDNKWYCYKNASKTSKGWSLESTCRAYGYYLYSDKQKVSNTANPNDYTTMYAQWKSNQFTVKYNAGGGAGSMPDQKITFGVSTSLSANKFTRSGYKFIGWKAVRSDGMHYCYTNPAKTSTGWLKSSDCNGFGHSLYKDKQNVSKTAAVGTSVTMTAQWTENKFRVVYNANGGSGNSYDQRITYGVSTAMYANRYTKSGYSFQGWYAQRSNGTWYCYTDLTKHRLGWLKEKDCYEKYLYKNQLKISNTAEPGDYVIMNAQWKTNQFTVRYYAGGGTGSMPDQKITYGVLTSLSTNKFTRSEYKFIGWNAQRSDGSWYCYTNPAKTSVAWTNQSTCGSFGYYTYSNNQRVSKTAPAAGLVRMVAQWKYIPTKFTVRFYKDENSSNSYDQKITYGVSTKLTSNKFTKSGYTFIGWKAVQPDGSHYCYTNPAKTKSGWLNKSDCNGFGHSLYKNNQSVSKTTAAGRIVYMYAQWKKNR